MNDRSASEAPASEAVAEGILERAGSAGVPVKLIGGLGCWFLIRGEGPAAARYRRAYGDVDIIVPRRSRAEVAALLSEPEFYPNSSFNAVQGETRLMFASAGGCKIDVFVGGFEMAHRVPFPDASFAGPASAAPPPELLLTKLQLHALTEKDIADVTGVLAFLGPGNGIDVPRFVAPLAADWGIWRTVTSNLRTIIARAEGHSVEGHSVEGHSGEGLPDHGEQVSSAAAGLLAAADAVPKSLRWKTRSRIGERVAWYQEPEEPETEPMAVR
jgi:hypothetical protein